MYLTFDLKSLTISNLLQQVILMVESKKKKIIIKNQSESSSSESEWEGLLFSFGACYTSVTSSLLLGFLRVQLYQIVDSDNSNGRFGCEFEGLKFTNHGF